ncbi:MAG: efflux RND transporter periplasmic adaptor subunit [Halieaceae bacterium]
MAALTLRKFTPVLMVVVALMIAALLIMSRPETVIAPAEPAVAIVDVAEVQMQDLRIPVQAQGTVSPHRDTTLVSEVGGKIVEVSPSFNAGGYVAAGDVLVQIDQRDYQAAVLRARAAVETAESNLAQEKGRAEVAFKEWQRQSKTIKRSEDARSLYLRKPQLEQAEAQLLSAQADLSKAQDDLDRTTIRAPYDCLIQEKRSDLGQYVGPGTQVARIFSVDYAEVRLAIPQSKLPYLDLPGISGYASGQQPMVDLYTDVSGVITHWIGKLDRTEATIDERSRVLFTVARIDDPYAIQVGDSEPLRVGTFVKANITGRAMSDLVVLPRYVLRTGNQLWVVDEQMTLRNRQVTTLRTEGDDIYVNSGLQNGDLVSLTTLSDALPGMSVRINKRTSTLQQPQLMEAAGAAGNDQPDADASDAELPADATLPDQTANDNGSGSTNAA